MQSGGFMRNTVAKINNGKDLEFFSTSFFQSINYFVDSNLKWIEEKSDSTGNSDILEIDVLAKDFSTEIVKKILIECKRGCTFNDLFKFSGVCNLVKPNKGILLCQSHEELQLKKIGEELHIDVKNPEEIIEQMEKQTENFTFYHEANLLCNKFFSIEDLKKQCYDNAFNMHENTAYREIRKYLSILLGEIWREYDLPKQAQKIKILSDSHKNFVRQVAKILNLKPYNQASEIYMSRNILCQSAGYLVLKVRIAYVISAVESAISIINKFNNLDDFMIVNDQSFIKTVDFLSEHLEIAKMIPIFLQIFLSIFGGIIYRSKDEINNFAKVMHVEPIVITKIIRLLKKLFQINNTFQWGFVEDMNVLSLKYTPATLKGLGIKNRKLLGFNISDFCFAQQWENNYTNY